MTREHFKTKEYFDNYIKSRREGLKEYIELLSDKEVLPERLYSVKETIFEEKLDILIAKYSRGDDIFDLLTDYKELMRSWKEVCSLEWIEFFYTKNLWFISIGIMLGMGVDIQETVKGKLTEENINDWLLNFLLSSAETKPEQIEGQLLMPEKYQTLKDAICKNDKAKFIHYLEKEWYSNCKDYGWYDSHKLRRRSQNIYFGYWCFEAGAIVKRLNWDDTDIAGQQYYPYDLVHYKE